MFRKGRFKLMSKKDVLLFKLFIGVTHFKIKMSFKNNFKTYLTESYINYFDLGISLRLALLFLREK